MVRQGLKTEKKSFLKSNSHVNVVTKWLSGWNRSLDRPPSRIEKVSIALASGLYSFMETKNLLRDGPSFFLSGGPGGYHFRDLQTIQFSKE